MDQGSRERRKANALLSIVITMLPLNKELEEQEG